MRNLSIRLRRFGFFAIIAGIIAEFARFEGADYIIKTALFLLLCSLICLGFSEMRRRKGLY